MFLVTLSWFLIIIYYSLWAPALQMARDTKGYSSLLTQPTKTGVCLEPQAFCLVKHEFFSAAEPSCSDGGSERGKDGWIAHNNHLYQPSPLLWGVCLRAPQNKLRVIFLSDADSGEGDNNDFSHVIKGIFTSACGSQRIVFIPQCDKYLIDARCCQTTGLQPTWSYCDGCKSSLKELLFKNTSDI